MKLSEFSSQFTIVYVWFCWFFLKLKSRLFFEHLVALDRSRKVQSVLVSYSLCLSDNETIKVEWVEMEILRRNSCCKYVLIKTDFLILMTCFWSFGSPSSTFICFSGSAKITLLKWNYNQDNPVEFWSICTLLESYFLWEFIPFNTLKIEIYCQLLNYISKKAPK